MGQKLREITYNTKKYLKHKDVVLPSDYSKAFEKFAKEANFDINDKETILEDLNSESEKIDNIVKNTNRNLEILHNSAKESKEAIIKKDVKKLENIENDITELQDQVKFLQKELFTDSLTKAYNRKWFTDFYLENEKFPKNGYLAFLDLNNFKQINDKFGHIVGDSVLKYLVDFVKKELLFDNCYVIRYAGDEFIILYETEELFDGFVDNVKTMQKELFKKQLKPKKSQAGTLSFTFSYGIVLIQKNDSLSKVIELADYKMYQNKEMVKAAKN